ncbi:hypothetical protein HK098_000842 [Nowakowskiella sp. JEL0407]|nr:hypothetical protein HK098_000842 [Nowakowskiella sp. JEL0407]
MDCFIVNNCTNKSNTESIPITKGVSVTLHNSDYFFILDQNPALRYEVSIVKENVYSDNDDHDVKEATRLNSKLGNVDLSGDKYSLSLASKRAQDTKPSKSANAIAKAIAEDDEEDFDNVFQKKPEIKYRSVSAPPSKPLQQTVAKPAKPSQPTKSQTPNKTTTTKPKRKRNAAILSDDESDSLSGNESDEAFIDDRSDSEISMVEDDFEFDDEPRRKKPSSFNSSNSSSRRNRKVARNSSDDERDERPECKYGEKCYRKNPVHFEEFRHPWLDKKSTKRVTKIVSDDDEDAELAKAFEASQLQYAKDNGRQTQSLGMSFEQDRKMDSNFGVGENERHRVEEKTKSISDLLAFEDDDGRDEETPDSLDVFQMSVSYSQDIGAPGPFNPSPAKPEKKLSKLFDDDDDEEMPESAPVATKLGGSRLETGNGGKEKLKTFTYIDKPVSSASSSSVKAAPAIISSSGTGLGEENGSGSSETATICLPLLGAFENKIDTRMSIDCLIEGLSNVAECKLNVVVNIPTQDSVPEVENRFYDLQPNFPKVEIISENIIKAAKRYIEESTVFVATEVTWRLKCDTHSLTREFYNEFGNTYSVQLKDKYKSQRVGDVVSVSVPENDFGIKSILSVVSPNRNPNMPDYQPDDQKLRNQLTQTYTNLFSTANQMVVQNRKAKGKVVDKPSVSKPVNAFDLLMTKKPEPAKPTTPTKAATNGNNRWMDALGKYHTTPEKYPDAVIRFDSEVVVIWDQYPKVRKKN